MAGLKRFDFSKDSFSKWSRSKDEIIGRDQEAIDIEDSPTVVVTPMIPPFFSLMVSIKFYFAVFKRSWPNISTKKNFL